MKSFLRVLLKCFLVLFPIWICILYIILNFLGIISPSLVGGYWNNKFIKEKQDKYYSVVILGDSTANTSYIPELLSDSTINLALSGSSVVENYYTLETYLANNEAPKDVFISFSDYHIGQDNFKWSNCNLLHRFSLKQNVEIFQNILKYGTESIEETIEEDSYWPNVFLYKTYMPSKYMYSIIKSFNSNRRQENEKAFEEADLRLGRHCNISNNIYKPESEVGCQNFSVSSLQDRYYKKLITLCQENNIRLHIVKMPLPGNYFIFDSYREEINAYYTNLLNGTIGVDFLWPVEEFESYYFADENHLNNHGSQFYSNTIKALYPHVFDDEISEYRATAIKRDVQEENDINFLKGWFAGLDYSIRTEMMDGKTYVFTVNNYTGEIISTKVMFLNQDGVYEMTEVE